MLHMGGKVWKRKQNKRKKQRQRIGNMRGKERRGVGSMGKEMGGK